MVDATGAVLGEGAHTRPGEPHAEIVALEQAGRAKGATVYVSLEPCAHRGRTPPCADRLIAERVARVVVATLDPDPAVSGRGVQMLRDAGIDVEVVDDPEARELDPAYFHHRHTGMPLVTLKYAMTLDGSSAAADLTSKWITGEEAREDAHRLRSRADAVVVGSGTLMADDPLLDVRLPGYEGTQPRPVVLVGESDLPPTARIWARNPLVVSTHPRDLPSGELVMVEGEGRPDPEAACRALAGMGLLAVLLEGGARVASAWWRSGVVGRGVVYVGAKLGGGTGCQPMGSENVFRTIGQARDVTISGVRPVGSDVRIDFNVEN